MGSSILNITDNQEKAGESFNTEETIERLKKRYPEWMFSTPDHKIITIHDQKGNFMGYVEEFRQ